MEIKVGEMIAGVKISWIGHNSSPHGQKRRYVRFTCKCGTETETVHAVAVKARIGKAYLRCVPCQDARRYEEAKKPAKKQPKPEAESSKPVSRTGGKIADATAKMLGKLKPEARAIADKLIREHVAACRRLGAPIENLDRTVLESIEEAQRELRHGAPTVTASLSKWEPTWRYSQYATPKDATI